MLFNLKKRTFDQCVIPVMTFGCGTWRLKTNSQLHRVPWNVRNNKKRPQKNSMDLAWKWQISSIKSDLKNGNGRTHSKKNIQKMEYKNNVISKRYQETEKKSKHRMKCRISDYDDNDDEIEYSRIFTNFYNCSCLIFIQILNFISLFQIIRFVSSTSDLWPLERPEGMPSIQSLEVMCGKDHMDVHLTFSQPFEGIVSSKGQHGDPR